MIIIGNYTSGKFGEDAARSSTHKVPGSTTCMGENTREDVTNRQPVRTSEKSHCIMGKESRTSASYG